MQSTAIDGLQSGRCILQNHSFQMLNEQSVNADELVSRQDNTLVIAQPGVAPAPHDNTVILLSNEQSF